MGYKQFRIDFKTTFLVEEMQFFILMFRFLYAYICVWCLRDSFTRGLIGSVSTLAMILCDYWIQIF